jgi:transposase
MAETRRKFDKDFREGAVRLVRETGKPIAQVARDLGINEGTLANWVNADKRRRGEGNGAQVNQRSITVRTRTPSKAASPDSPASGCCDLSRSSTQSRWKDASRRARGPASRGYYKAYLPLGARGRRHVCSMFARTSRYGPVAAGITRHPLSWPARTVRQVAARLGTE